jgi:UPF0755 protein
MGAAVLLLVALGVAAFIGDLETYAHTPAGAGAAIQTVSIEAGHRFAAVTQTLFQHGLIRSPLRFKIIARFRGVDTRIKAGEYELKASMSPLEVLDVLQKGAVKLHRVTIQEGLTLVQIAELVAKTGLFTREDFLAQAAQADLRHAIGLEVPGIEGYLFPDTYFFPRGTAAQTLIAAMLQRFRTVCAPEWEQRAAELGLSVHAAVTLASIIEKETGDPSERPLISSVFHNRLKRGMRLETDPAVIYGIKDFDGNLTRRHLETPTPYNTYLIKGLPPGPIANPGREALMAAVFPAHTDYLFFVSRNNGSHHFSASLSEHNRAVRQYQAPAEGSAR